MTRLPEQRLQGSAHNSLVEARRSLAQHMDIAEELIPLGNLATFYSGHESHARLKLFYPNARLHTDSMALELVSAFRESMRGQALPDTANCILGRGGAEGHRYAVRAAGDKDIVVFPKQCSDACVVAGYCMSRSLGS